MKKLNSKEIIAVIISSIFVLLFSNTTYAINMDLFGRENKKDILFINSYSPQFTSYDNQLLGLIDGLGEHVNLQVEYMDYGTFPEEENETNFYNLLKYKINKYNKFDAVILADDPALSFGKKYRNDLFEDIPMVFLGVNKIESAKEAIKLDNVYGIIDEVPVKQSVELISNLHSNKNIVALVYDKESESEELKQFYELESKYKNLNFNHISLGDCTLEEFEEKLNKLTKDDIVLSIHSYSDTGEGFINMMNAKKILKTNDHLIKYTTLDILYQDNFVGGIMTSNYYSSKIAGKIAMDIIKGNLPSEKLIFTEEIYAKEFNYGELKEHNISEKDLPEGSIILNKPVSFWTKYKEFIVPTTIIILCLVLTIIALIKNIKQRSIYEKEIIKAKEIAENMSKSQSNFISNVSHELRTPVAVIMSCSQLLNLNIEKEDKNNQTINVIRQNCYRLLRIVNNIIDVAKVDSGFMTLKLKNIEIVGFVENLVLSIVPYAGSKNLEVVFDTQEEEIIMSVDPDKIERIVLNLLSNAIKFSNKGGQIIVNIGKENENLIISIKDNGVGIDRDNIEKIFEKFVQVEDTLTRRNEGSGIGLSLVKSFVDFHGGNVYVDSKLNEGSVFIINLPIKILEGEEIHICDLDNIKEDTMSTSIEFSDIYT